VRSGQPAGPPPCRWPRPAPSPRSLGKGLSSDMRVSPEPTSSIRTRSVHRQRGIRPADGGHSHRSASFNSATSPVLRSTRSRHNSSYWSNRRRATPESLEVRRDDLPASEARLRDQAGPCEDGDVLLRRNAARPRSLPRSAGRRNLNTPLKSRRSSSRIVSGSTLVRRQPGGSSCTLRTRPSGLERVIRCLDIAVERDIHQKMRGANRDT
jgi:hypothetical protein